jgi:hypothetical protein
LFWGETTVKKPLRNIHSQIGKILRYFEDMLMRRIGPLREGKEVSYFRLYPVNAVNTIHAVPLELEYNTPAIRVRIQDFNECSL